MKYQVGDLIRYFQVIEARQHLCLVTKVDELPDGAIGFVYVEWLTEHAKKLYTRSLVPSAMRNDRNGYWEKL